MRASRNFVSVHKPAMLQVKRSQSEQVACAWRGARSCPSCRAPRSSLSDVPMTTMLTCVMQAGQPCPCCACYGSAGISYLTRISADDDDDDDDDADSDPGLCAIAIRGRRCCLSLLSVRLASCLQPEPCRALCACSGRARRGYLVF